MGALRVQSAQAVGRNHRVLGKNMQDALGLVNEGYFVAGVICDGCSENKHSEVGAALAASYLTGVIEDYRTCRWMTPAVIASRLEDRLMDYLASLLRPLWMMTDAQKALYVQDHLLFTVVGFIWTPGETAVFYAGDGTLMVDGETTHLNVGDTPLYPSYRLIPQAIPPGTVVPPFTIHTYGAVKRLMIGSDAWKKETEKLPLIWNTDHLQRLINRLSDREHRFSDDVSVITLQATE